jgi:hypothetical protein
MLARNYALVWFSIVAISAALYLGGIFNEQALLLVGFVTAALVFMGMMVVVPLSVSKQRAPKVSMDGKNKILRRKRI